jgi:hypothetical protein
MKNNLLKFFIKTLAGTGPPQTKEDGVRGNLLVSLLDRPYINKV